MPPAAVPPLKVEHVLEDERRFLDRNPTDPLSALCLSGGGVRSASFSLGVLQGLSRAGILKTFDYISTVSGGGYVGGWLSAWRLRAGDSPAEDPCRQLGEPPAGCVEPPPLERLRHLIKFLTPRTGLFSADVWTLIGTILRNLLVNWMLLIPIIAAAAMLPQLYLGVLGLQSQTELVPSEVLSGWYLFDWVAIVVLVGIAGTYAALQLPSLGRRTGGLKSFALWFLTPVLLVVFLFSIHRYWRLGHPGLLLPQVLMSAGGMMLPWILGGAIGGRTWRPWILIAAALAGALGRAATFWVHGIVTDLAIAQPQVFAVVDPTATLLLLFVQITLFIGLASREMSDEDREWWARAGAWVLISAAVWGSATAIVMLGPILLDTAVNALGVTIHAGRAGLALSALAAGLAQRAGAVSLARSAGRLKSMALLATAPLVSILIITIAADGNRILLQAVHSLGLFAEHPHPLGAALPEDLIVLGGLLILIYVLGRIIAINRFSLHGMYRNRLVRTFLGASRPAGERHPSPFTGFDAADDLRISDLASTGRPLHIVNATLNMVADPRLAAAERRCCSFTISALHSGTAEVGYRPSSQYAGGISLGEALTTSGAAVNSNMGAQASAALTFLLTVFNARLGVWLGNPGRAGAATWLAPVPAIGIGPLVSELLSQTTDESPYVNLSDGGHFENLGLYEMIRRRCRYIVIVDADADPTYSLGNLADAIRLVRIDFGVNISFPAGVHIGPVGTGTDRRRWAVGTIHYKDIDAGAENGVLLYLKPTILGDEPIDVANYARLDPLFPHQSTVNQWFDEAEFESYRALGQFTAASLTGQRTFSNPRELCDAATGFSGVPA